MSGTNAIPGLARAAPRSLRGTRADLLEHCVRQQIIISSQPLLDEFREVFERKFSQSAADVRSALQLFGEKFTLIVPDALEPPICRDCDDDVVLPTALARECAAISTGDQDLLSLDPFRGIRVLATSAFWKWESEHDKT